MSKRAGFTLLEMLAVVTLMGVIATVIVPRVNSFGYVAKEKVCFHHRAQINSLVERYHIETEEWPDDNLFDIGSDDQYFPDGVPTCPLTNELYRLDAATHRVIGHQGGGGGKGGGNDHSP